MSSFRNRFGQFVPPIFNSRFRRGNLSAIPLRSMTPMPVQTLAPVRVSVKPAQKQKKQKVAPKEKKDFLSRSLASISSSFSEPHIMFLVLVLMLLIFLHKSNPEASLIKTVTKKLNQNDSLKPIGEWVDKNSEKFLGLLIVFCTYFALPASISSALSLISVLLVILLPSQTVVVYGFFSVLSILYFKLKTKKDKYIILGLGFIFLIYSVL